MRGNYTDFIAFTFRDFYGYLECVDELLDDKAFRFDLNGNDYTVRWTGAGEYYRIEQVNGTYDNEVVFDWYDTKNDFYKSICEIIEG